MSTSTSTSTSSSTSSSTSASASRVRTEDSSTRAIVFNTPSTTRISKASLLQQLLQDQGRGGSIVWEWYKGIAKNHRLTLDVLDETLSKLLFWLPHNSDNADADADADGEHPTGGDAAWREVGYGILSLHRLLMHLALDDDNNNNNNNTSNTNLRKNHYGASIRTRDPPTIAATSVRICLTVIHSLMPSLISLAMLRAQRRRTKTKTKQPTNNASSTSTTYKTSAAAAATAATTIHDSSYGTIAVAASRVRLVLEKAKFVLRMTLLVRYWRQQQQQTQAANDYGIMLDGGLYHSDQPQESIGIPWDHALALQRRRNYVGERTGWNNGVRVATAPPAKAPSAGAPTVFVSATHYKNAKTVVAEFLYASRPLLWAWFESRYHHSMSSISNEQPQGTTPQLRPFNNRGSGLFKGWLLCLAMDVLSIRLLSNDRNTTTVAAAAAAIDKYNNAKPDFHNNNNNDPFAEREVKRRKLRLFLHLLRSPVWSTHTLPVLEGVSLRILRKIPVIGNLMETILWDWVLYYQHPFVSEEG